MNMKKGLVLEGGAMRGIYTAGVLDAFLEQDIKVDGVIGGRCHRSLCRCGTWMLLCVWAAWKKHPLLSEIYEESSVYELSLIVEDRKSGRDGVQLS